MGRLRFVAMELVEVCIPMRFSFAHALAARNEANNILVLLHTDSGHTGYGEVLPRPYLTGETVASAWDDLSLLWWPKLRELLFETRSPSTTARTPIIPPEEIRTWLMKPGTTRDFFETLRPVYDEADHARRTGSYAGLDIAATDAWAQAAGRPGCSLFGQPATTAPLSAVIGGGSVQSAAHYARIFRWLGFRHYKLKVGTGNDHCRAATVRRIIGPNADLRVDANAAWSAQEAVPMLRRLKEARISSAEQPVPAGAVSDGPERLAGYEALATVQREAELAVMADESLCTRADAEALIKHHGAKIWNLRLAKIGGFSGMMAMLRLAYDHFIRLHLGVLVGETSCLAAAQRACLGLASFTHVEYGFPRVLLRGDPFRGGPGGFRGRAQPLGSGPGLGLRLSEKALRRVTVRRESFR